MSNDVVINAEGLSKKYVIGHETERESYVSLRDVIARTATNAWRKTADMARGRVIVTGDTVEEFWALKNVSFEVRRGEVLGIIGRNGAGKSTLLKILSRITEPSGGRVTIQGRVASLLEVGTGFHPELTGRENVYLNGAILGMTRAEIRRRFDEIVAFAEVEKFLDTPVKRYSSGMYVRLAFAIAAHLDPEILIVDEVLAVGDAAFQKKCIGRMSVVSGEGRTVLFVSHNMAVIESLCQKTLTMGGGALIDAGPTEQVVQRYQKLMLCQTPSASVKDRLDREGDRSARITSVSVTDESDNGLITPLSSLQITIDYESDAWLEHPVFLIGVYDQNNTGIYYFDSDAAGGLPSRLPPTGQVICKTESIRLSPRTYFVNVAIVKGGVTGVWADYIQNATQFEVFPADINGTGRLPPVHILFVGKCVWTEGSQQ